MCSPMRGIRISWEDQVTELTARCVIEIIVIGIVATLVTDIWQRLLQAIAGVPPAQWGLIGRWVAGFPAASSFINRSWRRRASAANSHSVGIPLCDRHRLGRALCCDRQVWLELRPDAHFRAGGFGRATGRALVRHATCARHGLHGFARAKTCRGSRHERAGAHGFWDRPLPWRDRLGLAGRGGVLAFQTVLL